MAILYELDYQEIYLYINACDSKVQSGNDAGKSGKIEHVADDVP